MFSFKTQGGFVRSALMGALGGAVLSACSTPGAQAPRDSSIHITDKAGHTRISIGPLVERPGVYGIVLNSEDGESTRASLTSGPNGPEFVMYGEDGKLGMVLTLNHNEPYIDLFRDGINAARLSVHDAKGHLSLYSIVREESSSGAVFTIEELAQLPPTENQQPHK